jgi:uncharacterized SAM-binding protein YcdF (DUF218 family)
LPVNGGWENRYWRRWPFLPEGATVDDGRVSWRPVLRRIRLVLVLLFGLAFLFFAAVALDVYRYAQRDEARQADAAIVLGAGVYGQRPSPVLRERINHAIDLYRRGYVGTIIFTGGSDRPGALTEAEIAARYARDQGVPEGAILVETTSTDTHQNLANARAVAAEHGLDSFLLVSTPSHMRRTVALARDLGMEAYSSPTRTIRWINAYTRSRAFAREVAGYLVYLLSGD